MPGCRETISRWLEQVSDSIRQGNQAIEQALGRYSNPPDRRREMGRNSLQLVRNRFELSIVSQEYADVYRDALGISVDRSLVRAA